MLRYDLNIWYFCPVKRLEGIVFAYGQAQVIDGGNGRLHHEAWIAR
jgi:hypothetical protein